MIQNSLLYALLFCAVFLLVIGGLELLVRKKILSSDVSRRVSHTASGLFAIFIALHFSPAIFLLCNGGLLLFIVASYSRTLLHSVHTVQRTTYGEIFLPLGIFITYLLWHENIAVFAVAILIVTFADAAAGIIGDIRQNQRASRLGSIAFFATAFIIMLVFGHTIPTSLMVAFIISVVEKVSPYGSDNLTIPIATAVLLSSL